MLSALVSFKQRLPVSLAAHLWAGSGEGSPAGSLTHWCWFMSVSLSKDPILDTEPKSEPAWEGEPCILSVVKMLQFPLGLGFCGELPVWMKFSKTDLPRHWGHFPASGWINLCWCINSVSHRLINSKSYEKQSKCHFSLSGGRRPWR